MDRKTIEPNNTEEHKESNKEAEIFYAQLKNILKRFETQSYCKLIVETLFKINHQKEINELYLRQYALVHSLEAKCVYHREKKIKKANTGTISKIIDIYRSYIDPYLSYTLEVDQNSLLFILAIAKQQFPYQKKYSMNDLSRCMLLFIENNALGNLTEEFKNKYKFSPYEWIYMCFAVKAFCEGNKTPVFLKENFFNSKISNFPKHAIEPFLKISSRNTKEIAILFKECRRNYKPFLHIMIDSVFLKHPIIILNDKNYLLVHPELIIKLASEGLYELCRGIDEDQFADKFGKSFSGYVNKILLEIRSKIIISEKAIQDLSPGRSCDYLIELDDCFLLIECKATKYSHDLLTENALKEDTAIKKISDGLEQIIITSRNIKNGNLDSILENKNKPIIGLCIVFGDLEFVNHPDFVKKYIIKNISKELYREADDPFSVLSFPPQVFSIKDFEYLIMVLKNTDESILEIIKKKLDQDYEKVGDWNAYITRTYKNAKIKWSLDFLEDEEEKFSRLLLSKNVRKDA